MTGVPDSRRDFFVSFNKEDRAWATWIAWVLEEKGYSVFFQDWDFRGNFVEHMDRAHAQAHRTLAVLSDHYFGSDLTLAEWSARFAQDPAGREDRLVPVKTGPLTGETILGPIVYADLTGCTEIEAQGRLLERVKKAIDVTYRGKPASRPGFPGGPRRQTPERPRFPVAEHNLPRPNLAFVGRTEELAGLGRALAAASRTVVVQPQAITGLGGIGKTQLALAYAYAHNREYELIRWLRAEEPTALAADYAGMAPLLGLDPRTPDQASLIASIRGQLERRSGWLLVFDNAADPDTLRDYLPRTGTGHVLATARRTDWHDILQLPLDVMPEGEALELLTGRRDPTKASASELPDAKELAAELGYLPLALAQARAYMDETGKSLAGYRELLRTRRPAVLAKGRANPDYPTSIAKTWDISLEAAVAACPAAQSLLELLSFFAPDALPTAVLTADPAALPGALRDEVERDEAVAALNRFSLIRAAANGITVHRLVQAVTRDGLDETTTRARAEACLRLVHFALPRPGWEQPNWLAIGELLPHAFETASAAERLGIALPAVANNLKEVALYLEARAAWVEAEPLFRRVIAIEEKALGPEHPELAASLSDLARICWTLGRFGEAERLLKRCIAIGEKTLGREHPDVGDWLSGLANVCRDAGRPVEAESLFWQAIAIGEKTPDPEQPRFASRLMGLGVLYIYAGHHEKAEPLFRRAVAILERVLDADHPDLATGLNSLGDTWRAASRHAEAEPLLRRSLGPVSA